MAPVGSRCPAHTSQILIYLWHKTPRLTTSNPFRPRHPPPGCFTLSFYLTQPTSLLETNGTQALSQCRCGVTHEELYLQLIHQPTYVLTKVQYMTSIKLLGFRYGGPRSGNFLEQRHTSPIR
jgi:hypothetical protein